MSLVRSYREGTFAARQRFTSIGPLGGGLPHEGAAAEKFVPSLESLSSLSFEERNLGCPGNFAGTSRTPGGVQQVCAKKSSRAFFVPYLHPCLFSWFPFSFLWIYLLDFGGVSSLFQEFGGFNGESKPGSWFATLGPESAKLGGGEKKWRGGGAKHHEETTHGKQFWPPSPRHVLPPPPPLIPFLLLTPSKNGFVLEGAILARFCFSVPSPPFMRGGKSTQKSPPHRMIRTMPLRLEGQVLRDRPGSDLSQASYLTQWQPESVTATQRRAEGSTDPLDWGSGPIAYLVNFTAGGVGGKGLTRNIRTVCNGAGPI